MRFLFMFSWLCIGLFVSFPVLAATVQPTPAPTFGAFDLINQNGSRVTDANFRGSYMLVTFGYTHCPASSLPLGTDGCSPALPSMLQALAKLPAEKASRVLAVFVTLDPTRDDPATLQRFLAAYGPRIVGLTGAPDAVARMARAYGVSYRGVDNADSAIERSLSPQDLADLRRDPQYGRDTAEPYTIDHTDFIYLIGPDGAFVTAASGDLPVAALAQSLTAAIK